MVPTICDIGSAHFNGQFSSTADVTSVTIAAAATIKPESRSNDKTNMLCRHTSYSSTNFTIALPWQLTKQLDALDITIP